MSLTVKTCMGLPAFRYAKIVAGKGGINQTVNSITVLENSDVDVISSDLFLNHEMCITAFSSIKDDVDKQCAIVRRMKEIGICAVVLYYIGIFVPYLDDKLISTADEVNLPLICMPYNRFDFRYGEAINDVMYAIYRDKQENINFIPEILESISGLPERLRTIRSLLQIISDRFRCSFFYSAKRESCCPRRNGHGLPAGIMGKSSAISSRIRIRQRKCPEQRCISTKKMSL